MADRSETFERVLAPEPGRTALVVVDMQRGFLDAGEAMAVPPAREIVPAIQKLLSVFRLKRLPVVFTEFVYSESAPVLIGSLHPEHRPAPPGAPRGFGLPSSSCLEGTPSAETVPDLAPRPGEIVVRKRGYDAFAGTSLDAALRARSVTSLVVTGTMPDICVLAPVTAALHREYRVTVVEDGVATLWPEIQRASLDIIGRAYGRVVTAKEVVAQGSSWSWSAVMSEEVAMKEPLRFSGVMPANVLPFTSDLAIDEPGYRRHLRWLADTRGVTGIVANGHASEVSSLNREERKRSLAIALDEVGSACPVIAGVYSDGTQEAVDLARDARAAGAAGVLVFPPTLFMWGAQLKPDMVRRHFSELAAGADLPIVVFEYPPASGIGYSPRTLAVLTEIPQVAAVKDWSNEIVAFEANLRMLRATGRPVAMLSAFTMSLMATFLLGADGAISGMGSVTADLQAELFEACGKGDLDGARRLNDRLAPLVSVFYAPPFVDIHNRMKEALVLLGRIPGRHVWP